MNRIRFIRRNISRIMWIAFCLYMVMIGVFIVFVMGGMTLVVTLQLAWGADSFSESWMNMWMAWGPSFMGLWGIAYILLLPGFVKDVLKD